MFFTLDKLALRYDPFPIGVAKPLMADSDYAEMVAAYPDLSLFQYFPKVGHKYVLSHKFNTKNFRRVVTENKLWREFHRWVGSDAFIYGVMDALRERQVDLGFDAPIPTAKRWAKFVANSARGRVGQMPPKLSARFEFSILPADGGSVTPHTDQPGKIVTLVISMLRDDEWDPGIGGGTDVNRPKDPTLLFNRENRKAAFEDMEILDSYPYEPNQGVVFVKTFNSWHSVRPMSAAGSPLLRRTLTINIEARG